MIVRMSMRACARTKRPEVPSYIHGLCLKSSGRRRLKSSDSYEEGQTRSLDGYYNDILKQSHSKTAPTVGLSPSPESLAKTEREERIQKAQVVFGSRLAGPAERRRELDKSSIRIAGVLVPPRPDEPDNCCMSGCVNCVWELYRDELEEWASKSSEAQSSLMAQRREEGSRGASTPQANMPSHIASSMDDDGGGSETNWDGAAMAEKTNDLFSDIPVGIREFMRTEKKLRQRKAAD